MNKELSVWSLIVSHEFEKACERADEKYSSSMDMTDLRNKVIALLHLKKYNDAILLSEQIIEFRKGETDADWIFLGIEYWVLGNFEKAIEAWQHSQNSIYTDAAGGIGPQIFLYFAGLKTKQNTLKESAIKVLKKLLKSKRANNFPGPLGRYLMGDIKEDELFSSVDSAPILRGRELCQAHFVSAVKHLEAGDAQGYYKKLRDSISYGASSYLEEMFYLAKGELEVR